MLKLLDVGCGKGGVSEGFEKEGYDCEGIDIEDRGYPVRFHFVKHDIRCLNPKMFQGFDVIWVSMPCRDFCLFAKRFGKTWKANPPDPQRAYALVSSAVQFAREANPKFWIMENVPELQKYIGPARFTTALRGERQMVRSFWGNFPDFLMFRDNRNVVMRFRPECNTKDQVLSRSEDRAKIPLCVSRSFAKACKDHLLACNNLEKELKP